MSATRRVFVVCDDLYFRVNLDSQIRAAGLEPVAVTRPDAVDAALAAGAPRAMFVDLHLRGDAAVPIIERFVSAQPEVPVIAFGRHTDTELLERARKAGATAMPRSRFDREFSTLLSKIAVGTLTMSLQAPPGEEPEE